MPLLTDPPVTSYSLRLLVDWNRDGVYEHTIADIRSCETSRGCDILPGYFANPMVGQARIVISDPTGVYSPFNTASPLYGTVTSGAGVRLQQSVNGAGWGTLWTGYIENIRVSGVYGSTQQATFECAGTLSRCALARPRFAPTDALAGVSGVLAGQAIGAVLNAVGVTGASLDSGTKRVRRVHGDGETGALELVRRYNAIEGGRVFEAASGSVFFYDRRRRLSYSGGGSWTVSSDPASATYVPESVSLWDIRSQLVNYVAWVAPAQITPVFSSLGELQGNPLVIVYPGTPEILVIPLSRFPLMPSTLQAQVSASGGPYTASVTLISGSAAEAVITATGTSPVTVSGIVVRGVGESRRDDVGFYANTSAANIYGRRDVSLSWENSVTFLDAFAAATWLASAYASPVPVVEVEFPLLASVHHADMAQSLEIGDRLVLTHPGIFNTARNVFVERVEVLVSTPGNARLRAVATEAPAYTFNPWVVGTSALGSTTKVWY